MKGGAKKLDAIKSPFPWFGGKSRVAHVVWDRFGECDNYVEPFFGSGAVLLNAPRVHRTETVNDFDGFVANFWRAVQHDPQAVAFHADNPVNENDLHARHIWLVEQRGDFTARMDADPDFYDAKIAGWWCWGLCCWIGSGWCSGDGPWRAVVDDEGHRQLVHLGDAGQGVNRQLVHLGNAGRGVNRKLVHLGDAGRGVNRKRVHLGNAGQGVNRKRVHLGNAGQEATQAEASTASESSGIYEWMQGLASRLARVRVCCGDWSRVCGPTVTEKQGLTAVFLDPPYAEEAERTDRLYRCDSLKIANAVREWCIANGDNPKLRIALCGYEGEHVMPEAWECHAWKTAGGYSSQGSDADINRHKERIWFSPHCVKPEHERRLFE